MGDRGYRCAKPPAIFVAAFQAIGEDMWGW
jgi:hypothetical protein